MAVGDVISSHPDRKELGQALVVGATRGTAQADKAETEAMSIELRSRGKLARWWSFPLSDDAQAALKAWPYLYIYVGLPTQRIVSRYRIADSKTLPGRQGMLCPWPEYQPDDTAGKTQAGPAPTDVFKTWFLIDGVERLANPIPLNELETADGQSVSPSSLVNGFAIWLIRPARGSVATGGMHLLLKWAARNAPDTIDRHQRLADEKGSVWWGAFGTPGAPGLSTKNLESLSTQIAEGRPTYAFLYNPASVWQASIEQITANPDEVDEHRMPDYYTKDQCKLFVRLSGFGQLDPRWVMGNLVLASQPDRQLDQGALSNQTTPLLVRLKVRLIDPQSPSGGGSIAEALEQVLSQYVEARQSAAFGGEHPIFAVLQRLTQSLAASEPIRSNPHLKVKPSAGQGNWAKVPWVAIMDDRETTSTQKGTYCVYLFREDGSGVYLTLNQGVTEPQRLHGAAEGKRLLRERAAELREGVGSLGGSGFRLDKDIDLRSTAGLGADYEASTVAYKLYEKGAVPNDEVLFQDLTHVLGAYETALSPPTPPATLDSVLAAFSKSLTMSGVRFGARHDETVRSFLASVITKPLVILTGLSGSGKTQIAIKFGEWLGQEHLLVIPVRPDWTGPEAIFGYVDVLRPFGPGGSRPWSVPNTLAFMLKAARDPLSPYLLVLDEMNLAHVERYFADYLSGMESAQPILPNLVQEAGEWRESSQDPNPLPIPRNLFVVGTVNVDETTYMFSPKVLDRANTLEFRVATDDLAQTPSKPTVATAASRVLAQALLAAATDDSWQESHPSPHLSEFVSHIKILHRVLSTVGAEFGYRTFYETRRFASVYFALGGTDWEDALDVQVIQKVLPKLHGSRRRLEPTLSALGRFCFDLQAVEAHASQFDPVAATPVDPRLPASFEKIRRMTLSLRANQFASFTE
jgi:5-methylcytosine-specific restriction enzyme B